MRVQLGLAVGIFLCGIFPAMAADEGAAAKPPSASTVEQWIGQLSDRSYAVREDAQKSLSNAGTPILPILIKNRNHPDPEVRRRLEEMIVVMERAVALTPKRVTLHMSKKPLKAIVEELGKQTGYKLATDGQFNSPKGKELHSFKFDNMVFMEALDKICEESGLVVQQNPNDETIRFQFLDSYVPFRSYDGTFRVAATGFNYSRNNQFGQLPKNPGQPSRQSYETLNASLTVSVEPRMPILKIGQVRLAAAEDDEGTSMLLNNKQMMNQFMGYNYEDSQRSYVRSTQTPLAWPSKTSRTVKRLKGVIPITLLADQKPTLVTDQLATVKGKKIKISTSTFNFETVTAGPKACDLKISMTEEGNESNPWDYSYFQSLQGRLEIHDAKGNKYPTNFRIWSYNGPSNVTFSIGTNPANNSNLGPPAKLVYLLWVKMDHEVPFEFKDLPLP